LGCLQWKKNRRTNGRLFTLENLAYALLPSRLYNMKKMVGLLTGAIMIYVPTSAQPNLNSHRLRPRLTANRKNNFGG
jgi:hypothetical protein